MDEILFIVMPTYNEETNIRNVVEQMEDQKMIH